MKVIFGLVTIMAMVGVMKSSECPVHSKIGNAINFARLFKEQADSDWNYQNLNTDFKLRLHLVEPRKNVREKHKIVFEVMDRSSKPARTWFYCIDVIYESSGILRRIDKFARFRKYVNPANPQLAARINQLMIDNFFHHKIRALNADQDADYSEHYRYTLHDPDTTKCNPMTKMEYDYFYYLYTNYYKSGAPAAWGMIEPNLS